ncbi:hypothetical protein GF376_01905 [Candidatus Peregrinibacteria bacterium]|nr:hypothetical protein [Candidatus Peregrinibacteria bacterium]
MKLSKILIPILLTMVFAGCSTTLNQEVSGTNSNLNNEIEKIDSASVNLEPCELMTESEAEQVLGEGYDLVLDMQQAPSSGAGDWQKICFYSGVDEEELVFAQIAVIDPIKSPVNVKELYDEIRQTTKEFGEGYQEIDGIGTEAYRSEGLAGGLEVYDAESGYSFKLSFARGFGDQSDDDDKARQEELARAIVQKLRSQN